MDRYNYKSAAPSCWEGSRILGKSLYYNRIIAGVAKSPVKYLELELLLFDQKLWATVARIVEYLKLTVSFSNPSDNMQYRGDLQTMIYCLSG